MNRIDNSQVKLLLVDDNPVNLEISGKILEKENYDIYIADSAYTAIEMAETTDFDLILMDIMMPDMDGFESFKIIKQKDNYKDTPIIFLTAKVDVDTVVKGFELGAVDYIRKPFNGMELVARVRTHVELKKIREALEQNNKTLQEAYDQLEIIATTDPLTKLYNRREILKRLESELVRFERYHRPFSIIIADIDFFKNINDTYGHNFGDEVLKSVSELFQNNARKNDSISRWGGEEFLILLPETESDGAAILAEKLRAIIENTIMGVENQVKITMTFGITTCRELQSLDTLINQADSALYKGKQMGRNCIITYQD